MPRAPAKKMSKCEIVAIIVVFVMATLSCALLNYNYFFPYKRGVSVLIAVIMILYQQTLIKDSCHRCAS